MARSKQVSKINVVYKNGAKDRIGPALLDAMIDAKQVEQFERDDGWAEVGIDPIRGMGGPPYAGRNRRVH